MTDGEILTQVRLLPARTVLALTLFGECRGEPLAGQIAVGWVIKNRTIRRNQTVARVCLAPWQFSCWIEPGVNHFVLMQHAEDVIAGRMPGEVSWLACLRVANDVLEGTVPDPTGGAVNYLTTQLYESSAAPAWAKTGTVTVVIGHHTFLRE